MPQVFGSRKSYLTVTFACPGAFAGCQGAMTVAAGNTGFVVGRRYVCRRQWMPATIAQLVAAWPHTMCDGNTLVEDKTLTIPQAFVFRNYLQIFKDAAFQVVDFLEAFSKEQRACLFATDPSCAEHCDFPMAPR